MIGGTLFSGIGAPECAMPWIDWRWAAEIDPFASAVHAARFPGVPNLGDVEQIDADAVEPVDLVVFGSPCQSFSVAGKRLGLDDPRGNLALVALRLIGRIRPRWLVFENVPGVLSSDGGRDFGAFLGLMGECGYGFAYAVLDAQHFGVPQRRRRVFVVGCLGDWRGPATVLFEPESLRGDSPPRRETGERIAWPIASCAPGGSGYRAAADTADNLIAHAIRAKHNMALREDTDTLIAFSAKDHGGDAGDTAPTLRAGMHHASHANAGVMPAIAHSLIAIDGQNAAAIGDQCGTLQGEGMRRQNRGFMVAHTLRADGFDAGEDGTGRGTPLIAVDWNNSAGGPNSEDTFQTLSTRREPAVMTLAIRGRGDSHDLEYRDDGTANAILTPNGGRAGIGVGAVAFHENQRAETTLSDTAGSLKVGGGKPGQGYPPVMAYGIRSDAARGGEALTPSPDAKGRMSKRDPGFNVYEERAPTLDGGVPHSVGAVAFNVAPGKGDLKDDIHITPAVATKTLDGWGGDPQSHQGGTAIVSAMSVRRLTPRECERLQGFPDDFTAVTYRGKPAADGPRYRALGNSMAVPVIGWVLQRIDAFERSTHEQ